MKKSYIKALCLLLIISIVLMPCDFAWKWDTHREIVYKTYSSMPSNIKKNLDLNAMKDGSNDPDEKFKDWRNHEFPGSYYKAQEWLKKGKYAYSKKNYRNASYCFGVASHYISDTYSAPHGAHYLPTPHSEYEAQANKLTPAIISGYNKDLYTSMKQGDAQDRIDWNLWKKTRKSSIAQNDLNQATTSTYFAIRSCVF